MTWDSYGKSVERGPRGLFKPFLVLFLIIFVGMVGMGIVIGVLGWFNEATNVAQDELGPRALLKKYEWFKDASAQLDAKLANIEVYKTRLTSMQEQYATTPRAEWDRVDKQQQSQWQAELAGVKASYNMLAAEYNAQHAKINWAFMDVGNVPAGGKPLPREYKPYVEE